MATRIRTLNFLPEIFQTTTNSQFLQATLDQLVDQPNTQRIQGYVGSKFGYAIDAKDYYVTEPTKIRTDYQLEPGVVFTTDNNTTAKDFISYPGIVDALRNEGSLTDNQERLFNSQIYAWDSFTNLDPLVNFNQYYWIPEGPERVVVGQQAVSRLEDYIVTDFATYYNISPVGTTDTQPDPTITLLRGGRYTFSVNQNSKFWIQGTPGIEGVDPNQPNLSTRDIYGVTNNGIEQGTITFDVPFRDAQNDLLLPGDLTVDVVSNISFQQLNGSLVGSNLTIDGITSLDGLTVLFYNTGYPNELGYSHNFYNTGGSTYDVNYEITAPLTIVATNTTAVTNLITCDTTSNLVVGQTITFSGTPFGNINQYQSGIPLTFSTASITPGQIYYIDTVGTTDWISIGLNASANVQGYIAGNVLFVSNAVSGSLEVGQTLVGTGVASGTTITRQFTNVVFEGYIDDGSGLAGTQLTVTSVSSTVGQLSIGTELVGPGLPAGLSITGFVTGTGGIGTYTVSSSLLYATNTIIGTAPAGYSLYEVDTSQSVSLTYITGYDISPGRLFTATGTDAGTGIVAPYSPSIYFVSSIASSTEFTIATGLNTIVLATYLEIGKPYVINYVGTTDWVSLGAASNTIGTVFIATQVGNGTGSATELTEVSNLNYGTKYRIEDLGTTTQLEWNNIAGTSSVTYSVGDIITALVSGSGTGLVIAVVDVDLTTDSGTMTGYINQGLWEEGYYSDVSQNFYLISYIGEPGSQVISLTPAGLVPNGQKITALYGTTYINRSFYRSLQGTIEIIPYISAPLDTLYYQDGTVDGKIGIIKLIESNDLNTLFVDTDIVGKKTFTSTNGVVFTNGLKVTFQGSIFPTSYINNEYYVEGVGTSIELIPVEDLIAPEPFTGSVLIPWDTTGWDVTNYEGNSFIPVYQDYITIARNAINKNPWSRSNRWFHISVIQATAQYNNDPNLLTLYATENAKAKRPIIEFYPNLQLFNSGITGKSPIDFIDFRTTDAFSLVAGQENYYPDVEVYTAYTGSITRTNYPVDRAATATNGTNNAITIDNSIFETGTSGFSKNDTIVFDNTILDPVFGGIQAGVTYYIIDIDVFGSNTITISETYNGPLVQLSTASSASPSGTRFFWSPRGTEIAISSSDILAGTFQVGQYITDSTNLLPNNTFITNISVGTTTTTLTVYWGSSVAYQVGTTVASLVACPTPMSNFALFDGARVVFANDTDNNVRNKIYISRFSQLSNGSTPIITLSEAADGLVLPEQQTVAFRGYNYQGVDFVFKGTDWIESQQKLTVNQPPLFDVFDENNISFSDNTIYNGSSFKGTKLFSYGIGSGINDYILGFPLRFTSVNNANDISFDVNINTDTFTYVENLTPVTKNINTGYVFNYDTSSTYSREIGWQTTVSPSAQYQLCSHNFDPISDTPTFTCDIAPNLETNWPTLLVYNNNNYLSPDEYTVTTTSNSTTVTLNTAPITETVIQILILSTQVSKNAYYTVPLNLTNNPLNEDITSVSVGELRLQYQSIYINKQDVSGPIFGNNNFRDLGNLVPYANQIIQNSASLVLPGAFLRKQDHNLFNALAFNSIEYIKFKSLLVNTADVIITQQTYNPSQMLDTVLDYIATTKTSEQPFFWSDMVPNKAVFITNTYRFANSLETSVYPLSRVYDFSTANYYGVLVYLTRTISGTSVTKQLITGVDYTVSETTPSLIVTLDLLPNDIITIKEYNQTYGSYVPNTPTKLGLYPKFIPEIILDSDYNTPTYFIRGHDGSYNKLYGNYNETLGVLIDFRDQVLFEFEKRIYNNLKLSATIPIQYYEVEPGFFRTTEFTEAEFLDIYSKTFLDWIGTNRLDYKTQIYNKLNQFTYNYYESGNKLNKEPIQQGYWRGIYKYYYDTFTPSTTPWEMLGYNNIPSWWENRYGPAPYTSDNTILWSDLAAGYDYNNGNPRIIPWAIRPQLLQVLPVDSSGNLISPFVSIVGNYISNAFQRDWKIGDIAPVELSYRRSSSWPFDLMRMLALTKPAKFYNLAVDIDKYKYNEEFNQYLVNNRSHLKMSDINIYGNGTAVTSYINWIVDYEKQIGLNATVNIKEMLNSLDVRLIYRLAGFSDKTLLKFFIEKGNPNNTNASLLIPDESYQILLYDNLPFDKIVYSNIIVQLTDKGGYAVYGNSQSRPVFIGLEPINDGDLVNLTVEDLSVKLPVNYSETNTIIPYGTIFYSIQEVASFIASVGAKLTSQGMIFDYNENGIEVNWNQMVAEFMYYAQTGWEPGSIVTLNPVAKSLTIDRDSYIVQPLTLQNTNFILNDNLYPILLQDLSILRSGTLFNVTPLNSGDSISFGQFNISNFENGIVFNNSTLFDDVIYNLITGLRQQRIVVSGWKTAEWNGTIDSQGFILNQDNIKEWTKEAKYTKGEIVKYKNKYWTALQIVQPGNIFNELEWKQTDYDTIQKGLLPNASTRAYESTVYYNTNQANLENDGDLLGFSLIGYRPREYMTLADLTDITQINVYKNLIREKGTPSAANAFKGANLPQGGIKYDIYENWAIKSGEFGAVLNSNYVEILLNERYLIGNPATIGITNGDVYTNGVQQQVPLNTIFNYGRPITSPNILPTISSEEPSKLFPTAGYVNFNDVKMSTYYYSGMSTATNMEGIVVPISQLLVRDYVWIANYKEQWQVVTPKQLGQVLFAKNNLNNTVTLQFAKPHNLTQYQTFAIINFNSSIDGYYTANIIPTPYTVIVNATLDPTVNSLTGNGIAVLLQNQRVATPKDINSLPLLDSEFIKNTVWVDTDSDGSWAVYRKSINYVYEDDIIELGTDTFGSSVATSNLLGFLIGDSGAGIVYRYKFNQLNSSYGVIQTITETASFGSNISHSDDVVVITDPVAGKLRIYQYIQGNIEISGNIVDDLLVETQEISTNCDSVVISGDKNWIYVGDIANAQFKTYHKSTPTIVAGNFVTGTLYTITEVGTTDFTLIGSIDNNVGTLFVATGAGTGTGTASYTTYSLAATKTTALTSGDNFGYSISTNYDGSVIAVGAPEEDYSGTILNYGYAYIYNRLVQTFEVPYTNVPVIQPEYFPLAWAPASVASRTGSAVSSNYITANASMTGFADNTPVIFQGTSNPPSAADFGASGLIPNTVYYIYNTSGSTFRIKQNLTDTTFMTLTNAVGLSFNIYAQVNTLDVSVNGTLVSDNNYGVIGNNFVYLNQVNTGDIITISGSFISSGQTLNSPNPTPRIGVEYSKSLDFNTNGNELLIGAPFEIHTNSVEGAVYRYTDGGRSYGIVIGTSVCTITTNRKLIINGYLVSLTAGNATHVANLINQANITNIQANVSDGKLIISLINSNLAVPNQKLVLTSDDYTTFTELGIENYTLTQTILCPHQLGQTQFGRVVKYNEYGSFVASAPVGTRYAATTFDFVDNENDDDTVFDNNATQFIDSFLNAGAVYMFDYLSEYNESLSNVGQYVYAQSANAIDLDYGAQPYYGLALDFNNNKLLVGTPLFKPGTTNGQVILYENTTAQAQDWSIYRKSASVVDISKISTIQIFNRSTNNTLINLDYIDPLQGKILGAARENIDFISNTDPARYNITTNNTSTSGWGAEFEGMIWFDTSTTRFVNYHQNDLVYNTKYWASVFPGSTVDVYTWVSSPVIPVDYIGPGTVYNVTNYSTQYVINASGQLVPVYYFWVKNTNIVFTKAGKTLADSIIASYIADPAKSGINYFAPLLPNSFGIYNSGEYIQSLDSVLSLNFATGSSDDVSHNVFDLIRQNYADDFLPGLPSSNSTNKEPESLYAKYIDSLSGTDKFGNIVPDPFLPIAVQSGILNRPKQSFFLNRLNGLKNVIQYANEILLSAPFIEFINSTFIYRTGEINPSTDPATNQDPTSPYYSPTYTGPIQLFYDTPAYWEFANYWAPGYDNNTKATVQVQYYADLSTLTVENGTIATVAANGLNGLPETYIFTQDLGWTRIGVTNGTLQIKSSIYDYENNGIGFGNNFYDTVPFDTYPSEETKYLVRALNEELPDSYNIFRNKSLMLVFEYIQAETIESQNYLTWLNKTSLVDVSHTIRELLPYQTFRSDNQEFLAGYINEVKPYHVVIKDFLFKYTGTEVFTGNVTDFDLPAKYNTTYEKFISPELVYRDQSNEYQYLPTSDIWTDESYNQWYNNFGLSLTGQEGYLICSLTTFISLNVKYFFVDNAFGLPSTGTLLVGSEKIGYTEVDRTLNLISGLTRGVDNTTIATHVPGTNIYIDLPGVIILDTGRDYDSPPRVIAYTDPVLYPAPRKAAILQPVMVGRKVDSIRVVDPGEGYAVTPTIIIDPSIALPSNSDNVSVSSSTIRLYAPFLETGDIVQYIIDPGSTVIGGLENNQWYYVHVLETSPIVVIGLYTTYQDAINDTSRVRFASVGSGTFTLNQGARATAITTSTPIRENIITLRYDRTSYNPSVIVWRAGEYYGAYYAGLYNNTLTTSSSSIKLQSTQPSIDSILASAQGVSFEIADVRNDQTLDWSSLERDVSLLFNNTTGVVRLVPKALTDNASGSTLGMVVGMPVQFKGLTGDSGVQDSVIYYVAEIIDETDFRIALSGPPYTPVTFTNNFTVGPSGLKLLVAEVINKAVLTVYYPGITTVTETTSQTNAITIPLNLTGTGGTNNFYIGMPVFFTGNVFGGIIENDIYYVNGIIDNQNFTVSTESNAFINSITETIASTDAIVLSVDNDNYSLNEPVIFSSFIIPAGEFLIGVTYTITRVGDTDFTLIGASINSVGIRFVATGSGTGSGLASSNVFGNLVTGTTYYVVNKIDTNKIQVSTVVNGSPLALANQGPIDYTLYPGNNNIISQKNALQLSTATGEMTININLPVSPGQINGQLFTLYPTSSQNPDQTGTIGDLIERSITATLSTVNRITFLSEGGGLDNLYVNMPLVIENNSIASQFTADLGFIAPDVLDVTAILFGTILTDNTLIAAPGILPDTRIIAQLTGTPGGIGTYQVSVPQSIASTTFVSFNLDSSLTYYIKDYGITEINSLSTIVGYVVCDTTDVLYVGMPIIFSGSGIGGVNINQEYYVESILDSTRFSLSNSNGGPAIPISVGTGSMKGRGEPWITVSTTIGGSEAELVDEIGSNKFIQSPTSVPEFDVSYVMGGYRVIITNPGSGFAVTNTITIDGLNFGGTSENNLTLTVNSINEISFNSITNVLESNGEITNVIASGVTPGSSNQYYLKVISPTELEVYSNPLMTVPVSGLTLPYVGTTSSTVTSTVAPNTINVDTTGFNLYDPVVFTGGVQGGLVAGLTYYIYSITPTSITVSEEPKEALTLVTVTNSSTSFNLAKVGDYAVLPEPFYFNQSIVKYNNQLYVCVISNNDDTFVPGKWQLLPSGSRRINELDRIVGYYQPTDDMPGLDISQLVDGTRYPNSIYLGNAFQPDQQFELDTVLSSTTFYPTQLNLIAVSNRKTSGVIAVLNADEYSGYAISDGYTIGDTVTWTVSKLSNFILNITNIITTASGMYVVTTSNYPNNILLGTSTELDESDLRWKSIVTPSRVINDVTEYNGLLVAVGDTIIVSADAGETWTSVATINTDPRITIELKSVTHVSVPGFTGFVAVGSGQFFDYSSGLTNVSNGNTVFYSVNGYNWSRLDSFSYFAFNSVSSNGTNIIAVGENNVIYYSQNGLNWIGVSESTVLNTIVNTVTFTYAVALLSVATFNVNDKVQFYGTPFGGLLNNTFYYIKTIDTVTSSVTLSLTPGGATVVLTNAAPVNMARLAKVLDTISLVPNYVNLNRIYYSDEFTRYIAVGNSGFIFESVDGLTWPSSLQFQTTQEENLYGITDSTKDSVPYSLLVGDNNSVAATINPAISWDEPVTNFVRPEQTYSIQGDAFTAGYGPQELVPGVVSDNITMIVTTRPGTNWSSVEYAHVGYKVISKEIQPSTFPQFVYSFANIAQSISQIRVSVITRDSLSFYTLFEQALYSGNDVIAPDYTIDWINKTVTLVNSLALNQFLRIDVYETGNGDQLVKSNTDIDPIRYNSFTEWVEIYLNCNYSANIFSGSGVIQPGTQPKQVLAFATESASNSIFLENVTDFVLNEKITFSGGVFGNITEETDYYVKTISYATNSITVSLTFNLITGTSGPTFNLTDDTGEMYAIIQPGTGLTWSTPLVFHNGGKLIPGVQGTVTRSESTGNTLVLNSVANLIVGSRIVFDYTIFGNLQGGVLNADEIEIGQTYRINYVGDTDFTLIGAGSNTVDTIFVATGTVSTSSNPGTVTAIYYIESIVDANQITISSTNGGPVKTLLDQTGGASFITNDYAFGIQPNGIQATMVFSYPYDASIDYISYTLFGETEPAQYGGTLPECELILSDGSTTYNIGNYIGGTNPNNAVVEVNGYRLVPNVDYTLDSNVETLTFLTTIPGIGDTIAVTSYNLTERQYFTTNTYTGVTVSSIVNIQNTIFPPIAQAFVDSTTSDGFGGYITCAVGSSTAGFIVGQYVQFYGSAGASGIDTNGTVYTITQIINSSDFRIDFSVTSDLVGVNMSAVVGGQDTTRITTLNAHGLSTNDLVRIDGVLGSVQLNNNLYYVHVMSSTQFDIYFFDPENPSKNYDVNQVNNYVINVSSYVGGGFAWINQQFILETTRATDTYAVDNSIEVLDASELIIGTPVVFMENNLLIGNTTLGGIVTGQTYYVKTIDTLNNKFTISETRGGSTFVLTNSGPGSVIVTQWNQDNTDRLWVTVAPTGSNGARVPSSSLRINEGNDIGILAEIDPTDTVIITSMMPSSTPDEETYLININQLNDASTYRVNYNSRTWLTKPLNVFDNQIYVQNAKNLILITNQTASTPALVNNLYYIGLNGNRNLITGVTVFNTTKNATVSSSFYSIEIIGLVPTLVIQPNINISQSDILLIEIYEGNLIYVNGEQINFSAVDLSTNILSGLSRGVNGTGDQFIIPENTEVYGLLTNNKLTDAQYNETWNPIPGIYNVSEGDPLQIADTTVANFLKPSSTRNEI